MKFVSPNDSEQARNERLDRAERNRRNAQNSTGPRTTEGKNTSKLNAVTTALTGRTVLLPTDDLAQYEAHVRSCFANFEPKTEREEYFVQSIADTEWRLERITQIESSLYAMGRVRFEADLRNEMGDDVPDSMIPTMLNGHVYMFYEKQFRNLSLQETRLRRQRDKDESKLLELQKERKEKEEQERVKQLDAAASAYDQFLGPDEEWDPVALGFDFSVAEIRTHWDQTYIDPAPQSNGKNS